MESLENRVRRFCSEYGLKLKKSLGQNFLIDEEILEKIVSSANIEPTDHIVEIGPGIGILTSELLKKAKKITAIELDSTLIPLIKEFIQINEITNKRNNEITLIQDNALKVPFPKTPYKVVANIPYHITSPLLRHAFLESDKPPTSLTLLIQREVAEKICDEKNAGLLTILVNLFGKPEIITTVPPKSFLPPPKVDSAVLHIDCFEEAITDKETIEEIFRLTKAAFGQRRKILSNTIGAFHGGVERLSAADIDKNRRPQTLSVAEWVRLAKTR